MAMKDGKCRVAMQHRLGLTPLPVNAVGLRCPCRAVTTAATCDYTMTCASVTGKALRRLPGLEAGARSGAPGSATAGMEARGDILIALETGLAIVDLFVTHPPGVANRAAAARTDGAAAERRD
jgi:hypothetical protein